MKNTNKNSEAYHTGFAMFTTEADVSAWVESVDERTTRTEDIQEELAAAWQVVYGHPLTDEDADTQRDAWSHLCSAVL